MTGTSGESGRLNDPDLKQCAQLLRGGSRRCGFPQQLNDTDVNRRRLRDRGRHQSHRPLNGVQHIAVIGPNINAVRLDASAVRMIAGRGRLVVVLIGRIVAAAAGFVGLSSGRMMAAAGRMAGDGFVRSVVMMPAAPQRTVNQRRGERQGGDQVGEHVRVRRNG